MADPSFDATAAAGSALASSVDFDALNKQLESEKELGEKIREQAKAVEKVYRQITSHLNKVHSTPAAKVADVLVAPTADMFAEARKQIALLAELVPPNRYYQWNQNFDYQIKNLTSVAALTYFLGTSSLLSKASAEQILGLDKIPTDRLMLSTEDYLHSLISVINELSRLAVTSVTLGDFATPITLSKFVKDLHAGFQLLNLKNNDLRKRFDSIKYDVKKIEEVVYDISLRGLLKTNETQAGLPESVSEETKNAVLLRLTGSS